jgi:hypothetical protein
VNGCPHEQNAAERRTLNVRLPALNGWHQRDCIPWLDHVIALNPFGSGSDQQMLIPGLQAWRLPKEIFEQALDGCSFRQFDRVWSP